MRTMEEKTVHAIESFLRDQCDLDALQDELAQVTWDNPGAPALALEAELLIAETTNGHRSDEDLRSALAAVLREAYATA